MPLYQELVRPHQCWAAFKKTASEQEEECRRLLKFSGEPITPEKSKISLAYQANKAKGKRLD